MDRFLCILRVPRRALLRSLALNVVVLRRIRGGMAQDHLAGRRYGAPCRSEASRAPSPHRAYQSSATARGRLGGNRLPRSADDPLQRRAPGRRARYIPVDFTPQTTRSHLHGIAVGRASQIHHGRSAGLSTAHAARLLSVLSGEPSCQCSARRAFRPARTGARSRAPG
jgi:hypothetical protein